MAIEYKIDSENQLIIATACNRLTEDEFMDCIQQITSFRRTADFDQLVDLNAVKEVELSSTSFIRRVVNIATSADKPASTSKLAIVASSITVFALSRVYEVYRNLVSSSTVKVSVFKTLEEAMSFLSKE